MDKEKLLNEYAQSVLKDTNDIDQDTLISLIKKGAKFNEFLQKKEEKRKYILGIVEDLVKDFTYYDRKEDEDLTEFELDSAIQSGIVTIEEIVKTFEDKLRDIYKK